MENQHVHDHSCAHCSCHNPVLALLKDELFNAENFAALPITKSHIKQEPKNVMFSGGTIRPMINGSVETVPAIGFANGSVVVSGTEQEVKTFMDQTYAGYTARVLEPEHVLLPGLIEPHVHLVPTAILMGWADVGGFVGQDLRQGYDIKFLDKTIKEKAASVKKGHWVLGAGLDPALMPLLKDNTELITIGVEMLDAIHHETPLIIIAASMHTLYANTAALRKIFDNPENKLLRDEYHDKFEKYVEKTQGRQQESKQMKPALRTIPKEQMVGMFLESFKYLKEIFQTSNERGVTFMYDAGMTNGMKALLDAYLLVHQRPVRIGAAYICNSLKDAKELKEYKAPTEYKDVFISHAKVISDGSNQGLTGYQEDAYLCKAQDKYGIYNFGIEKRPLHAPKEFNELMQTIIGKGWPVMLHANGDLAVQFAIEAYQKYIPTPVTGVRHRIEHCSLTTQQELDTMKQLQVSPSFLIGHVGYWGYAFQEAIFGPKSSMLDLCNSALNTDMRITLHSDHSVSPIGPLRMMEQSVTRIMEADPALNVLNSAECITREQALKAITYDAAWQCYAEQWTGSLKTGNFADFIILEQDPLTIKDPYMNMRNIDVLETWVGGVQVHHSTVSKNVSLV